MARRIIAAVLITIGILFVVRHFSTTRRTDVNVERDDTFVFHRTVTGHEGAGGPLLTATVRPAAGHEVMVEYGRRGMDVFHRILMERAGDDSFEASLPHFPIATRVDYALTVSMPHALAIRLPAKADKFYTVRYKGEVSRLVIALHIVFMFASLFFMLLALFGAVRILRLGESKRSTVGSGRWALLCSFIGGWPLGFILNYQAFGVVWEGYPFGRDITDNKTQVIFLVWLASLLLVRGSFLGRGEEKDRLGARAFAWVIVGSFVVSFALFIVPHSM